MKELMELAAKFLNEHIGFNEITVTDVRGTVRLVRFTPAPETRTSWGIWDPTTPFNLGGKQP